MLHGRQSECTRIDELLDAARAGRSGTLVLRGEAGIGKSALLRYAAERATGMRILRCIGTESESEFAFAAVHQLLHPVHDLIDAIPDRPRAALRGAFGLGPPTGDGDRFLISLAVLSVLAEAAEERPLLCLVDDAHWLDGGSAGALTFVARRLDAEGIAILFAARDHDAASFDAPGLPDLVLSGLPPDAAGALLAERSTVDMPVAVRDRLVASTAGNPLALLELPAALSAAQLAGAEDLPHRLPVGPDVEQVFLDRVRRESADTQTLLLIAAAHETGDLDVVLRAAAGLGVDGSALDAAERSSLVRVDAREVTFRHPLVRTAVYRGATFRQRREAQRALAAVMDREEDRDRRAWHLAAGALGPDESVADELHRSAEQARRRGGHAAAATAYERSAQLTAAAEARSARFADAADAAWLAGTPARARALLDRAAAFAPPPRLLARITHLRGAIETACGDLTAAYAILLTGAEPIADLDPGLAARMLTEAGQVAWLGGDVPALREAGRRLAALPAPEDTVRLRAELVLGLDSFLAGDTAAAVPRLRDVADQAPHSPDPRAVTLAAAGALFLGDDAVAIRLFATAVTRARSAGAAAALPLLLAPLSSVEAWTGRYAAAFANASEGLRIALETEQDNPSAHLRGVLAWLAAVQGRADECRAHAGAALSRAVGNRLGPITGISTWALGLLDLGSGHPVAARDRLAALAAAGPGDSHPVIGIFSAADLVEATIRADGGPSTHNAAHDALERLATWAADAGAPWAAALVARCRGLLEGDADAHFTEALALHAGAGRPFDAARTHLLYGELLRRRRRRADARVHLRAAHETFERLDARPWADLAGAELRATGETARKRDPSTVSQLTPQEVQIVRIVGSGATNREVAAQLFLSPRTVDYHLRKIFTKLDVTSRAELIRRSPPDT
jgi:DNA-binding CsgD family transcriptional regulator